MDNSSQLFDNAIECENPIEIIRSLDASIKAIDKRLQKIEDQLEKSERKKNDVKLENEDESTTDSINERLLTRKSKSDVHREDWSYKHVIPKLIGDIDEIKSQLAMFQKYNVHSRKDALNKPKFISSLSANSDAIREPKLINFQQDAKPKKEIICESETQHAQIHLKRIDSTENFDSTVEFLKAHLKRLHDTMTIKINEKSKKRRDALDKCIQAITKDVLATQSTQEQMHAFVDFIAASSNENKIQLFKLQLEMVKAKPKTVELIKELKSIVEIASDNKASADKYTRLEQMVSQLTQNSAFRDCVDQSVKQQLAIETSRLIKLSTKLQQLETKNNEMQCFVDEMAKLSDPDLKKNYELLLCVVKAMQDEIAMQKKSVQEKISQSNKNLNEKIVQVGSVIVGKSTLLRSQLSVTSSQLLLNFTVDQLEGKGINILSVFNGKIMISSQHHSELLFYNREGHHLSSITINDNDKLWDATWTPRGNIVYTTSNSKKVVVMSESGKVITTHTQMTDPYYLSVSSDDIIYLADFITGVYQSTDDGVSWRLVFKSTGGWYCWQVIKVSTDHSDDFWTLEKSGSNWHLRVYSVDKRRSDCNVTWKDVNVTLRDGTLIDLKYSTLLYDGNMNIFLSDCYSQTVHVLSVNGQYQCQLLSPHHIKNNPYRLAVEMDRQLLHIGQDESVVGVFKLT